MHWACAVTVVTKNAGTSQKCVGTHDNMQQPMKQYATRRKIVTYLSKGAPHVHQSTNNNLGPSP